MAISRLQASLAQATNEVTIAAANINFDFCLVKYEAPKEYRPLGKLLSLRRKQDAEHGKIHATARRLAALFDEVCPDTPNLIKAYGERVSDISKQATDQESRDYSRSVFGSYAGIDGTSIWAAATSSETAARGAIQVHLLACILSLMFDAAEATSIWIELVEERRRAITTSWEQDEPLPFSLAQAAGQQEITRGQLAEWDSSARAWLQTADSIMAKKQTQLRLILKNIKLPMGSETGVYPSVIDTWKKALLTMERLVSGVPQEVQDGSAIIGLAAWHIYPDINYFGTRTVEVRMNDLLVASGGILSLGCSPSATTPMSGISWSLSLTQLKYYGQPVQRRGSFRPDPERISFKELVFTVLGCVLSRWHVSTCRTQTSEAIEVINLIWENFKGRVAEYANNSPTSQTSFRRRIEGLRLLSEAAKEYSEDEDTSLPFINLGRNRCQFLPCRTYIGGLSQPYLHPFFGLCSVKTLLKSFRNSDGRVEFLRRMAMRTKSIEGRTCIIQYTEVHTQDIELINYASVFPRRSENAMDGQEHNAKKSGAPYTRWLHRDLMSMNWTREMVYENDGIYTPSLVPRLICSYKKSRPRETFDLQYWYGDSDTAAIYIRSDELSTPVVPKITPQDVLWCLKHDLLSPEIFMLNDSIMRTLDCLAMADTNAFQTIPGPVIQVQILGKPLIDAGCMAGVTDNERRLEAHPRISAFNQAISILSYFVASHDIPHSKIPCNIVGISMGDSIFVPEQVSEGCGDMDARPMLTRNYVKATMRSLGFRERESRHSHLR